MKTFGNDLPTTSSSSKQLLASKLLSTNPGVEGRLKSPKKVLPAARPQIRRKILPKVDIVDADADDDDVGFPSPPLKRLRKPTSKFDDYVVDESTKKTVLDHKTTSSGDEVRCLNLCAKIAC